MAIKRHKTFKRLSSEQLERRVLLAADPIKINFQPNDTINAATNPELTGYVADDGDAFGNRGNDLQYGWLDSNLNPDDQRQTRNRNNGGATDERYDTLNHMIKGDNHSWQIALDNGSYGVRIVAGDPGHTDQVSDMDLISGENVFSIDDPDGEDNWDEFNIASFDVTNGLLRLTPRDSGNNQKLAFIEITPLETAEPELPILASLPATDIEPTSAQLNGEVSFDGNSQTAVTIYYGDNDAGQSFGWDHSINVGFPTDDFQSVVEGLTPGTQYYYRVFGLNFAGFAWSPTTSSFTTPTIDPPTVTNNPVIDVEAFEAVIGGQVNDSGNEVPTVTLYWGDNDGGLNSAAWDNVVQIGPSDSFFSTTILGLNEGQTYYYRAAATNSVGTTWAPSTESFDTLTVTLPAIVTDPAAQVGSSSAQLGGTVTDFGNDAPLVAIYYGTNDAQTDAAGWQNVVEFSPEFGTFAQTVTGLNPESEYFFRTRATNAAGTTWAPSSRSFTTTESPTLLITEFLASNSDSLSTRIRNAEGGALGDTINPDWIEIYNPGTTEIDLGGLSLTDDADNRNKWQFPGGTKIAANGYLIVFASGEDIVDPALDQNGRLHTNFRLSTGGEFLAIADPAGEIIHAYETYPNQRTDISYGIDLTSNEHYYSGMTPGAANSDARINLVADTTFSEDRGFYDAPFDLEITTKTPGATIVYTTDGTKPTRTNGTQVAAANDSTPPVATLTIATTTLVRSYAFKEGFDETNVDTHSYIFLNDVLNQATNPENGRQETPAGFPTSWGGGTTGDYQVDPDIVNHSRESDRLKTDDLKSVPTISIVMDNKDLFGSNQIYLSGSGDPRSMSIEMITDDGSQEFQQDASIQVQGGSSTNRWKDYKLSLRVKFQSPFGPPKLNHALYTDSTIDRYDNITLDGVLNHAWVHSGQHVMPQYIQDQYVADLHNAMDGYSPNGRFVHLYLNGLYWGMYYMHDRPDHAWAAEKFGGNKDSYHAVKHSGSNVINNGNGNSARSSYNDMVAAARDVQRDPSDLAKWQTLTEQLDVDNFITYSLANWFTGNHDWPHKNWYATAPDGGPWRFHSWDAEHATDSDNDVGESPSNLHSMLDGNAEYATRMADLIHKHFFNDGVLTVDSTSDMWRSRMDEIDRAIVGESARWGDNRSRRAHTREEWLRYNGDNGGLLEDYFPGRSARVLGHLRSAGIYPSLDAPEFNQHGGFISDGFQLTISNPDNQGTIYFTTDGSDPRLIGGSRNPNATAFDAAVTLSDTAVVKARILNGTTWSALTESQFIVSAAQPGDLVISELNYNPYATMPQFGEQNVGASEFEFIEIQNISDQVVDLTDVKLEQTSLNGSVNGVEYLFEADSLSPGQRTVVVANREAFASRYGEGLDLADGQFSGQLANSGEQLTLKSFDGRIIQQFRFNDSGSWPGRADGGGSSLELIDADGDPADGNNWRSSSEFGGSPGTAGTGKTGDIVINEVLTHTDLPQIDVIEFHNSTNAAIDISNWYVSDSGADYFRYQVPAGTDIAANGYAVFNENQLGFGFRGQESDDAWLIEADSMGRPIRFVDHVRFGAAPNGVSLGRWPNASGNMFPMVSTTIGDKNAGPIVSDVILSEIYYHPSEPAAGSLLTRDESEFIEIWNTGSFSVDVSDWRIDDAVEFAFSGGTILAPNSGATVVNFDPIDTAKATAFRILHGLAPTDPLLGPYKGKLDNGGEKIEFERPEDIAQVGLGYVLVDHVAYDDMAPWPTAADGLGASLNRTTAESFGDFASSWRASDPSPGNATFAESNNGDVNDDGILDAKDIDMLCASLATGDLELDLNGDGQLDLDDYRFLIFGLIGTTVGDANVDGEFNPTDLIQVFQVNEYEDGIDKNSTWGDGDWNCDGEFDSGDLVAAFQAGDYSAAARPHTPSTAANRGVLLNEIAAGISLKTETGSDPSEEEAPKKKVLFQLPQRTRKHVLEA